jgi:hypothetical protein
MAEHFLRFITWKLTRMTDPYNFYCLGLRDFSAFKKKNMVMVGVTD